MVRERKKSNLKLKDRRKWPVHCDKFARNLSKSALGGVIFGCKDKTMQECYSKQLFGLPESHFSYVKNIEPGLPLFLFNASGRKLNGIFEATSCGRLNIDPNGWAHAGERSPYAAQVRVKLKAHCNSLSEEQFKPIISENYYFPKFLCFELDKEQTRKLIFLFSLSVVIPLCRSKRAKHEEKISQTTPVSARLLGNSIYSRKNGKNVTKKHTNNEKSSEPPVKEQSSLFKKNKKQDPSIEIPVSDKLNQDMDPAKLLSLTRFSLSNMELCPSGSKPFGEKSDPILKIPPEEEDCFIVNGGDIPLPPETLKPAELPVAMVTAGRKDVQFVDAIDSVIDLPQRSEVFINSSLKHSEIFPEVKNHPVEVIFLEDNNEDTCDSKSTSDADINDSSDLQTAVTKLLKMNEQLIASQTVQSQKIILLEKELKISRREVQQLKNHYVSMGTGSISESKQTDDIMSDSAHRSGIHDSMFIVGGFDGISWLSSLDLYSPAMDTLKPLTPMKFSRSYTSAAKLNDKIFVLGGGDRVSLFNTVESYDQRTDEWISQSPLNKKKGSLVAETLNNKIYVIGGGNFSDCFSEVEVLDPNVGRWIYTHSMTQKRFAPAVATINGAIYVVGGYDGTNYLKSAERLDVRESSWTKVPSMNACRGCHCLTVLGEKLYAVGGYDGSSTLESVEVFEPRKGVWRGEKPMKEQRAYAGAATIGETIFVMGGVNSDENISETVEVYKEGQGWRRNLKQKSIGKRSFFTTIVA